MDDPPDDVAPHPPPDGPRAGRDCPPLLAAKAAAGFPSPATDHVERRLDLHEYLVLHPEATFFMRVRGDSMTGAGIHDGDLLVVDRSLEPAPGRVVVAAIDGELVVKRLQRSRGRILLKSENPACPDIAVGEDRELQIWGVVAYVVHAP